VICIYFFSRLSFFFVLSPTTFLFRVSATTNIVCSTQTLSLQILPFCLPVSFNAHFVYDWLLKLTNSNRKSFLIFISSFRIFFLLYRSFYLFIIKSFCIMYKYYLDSFLFISSIEIILHILYE